jgi:hypothetical protein
VAQYPAVREVRFVTGVQRFLDQSEQRYRDRSGARRRWVIDLTKLEEGERATLEEFFRQQQGRFGAFDFEDPWTGAVIPNCHFDADEMESGMEGESDGRTRLAVIEASG